MESFLKTFKISYMKMQILFLFLLFKCIFIRSVPTLLIILMYPMNSHFNFVYHLLMLSKHVASNKELDLTLNSTEWFRKGRKIEASRSYSLLEIYSACLFPLPPNFSLSLCYLTLIKMERAGCLTLSKALSTLLMRSQFTITI